MVIIFTAARRRLSTVVIAVLTAAVALSIARTGAGPGSAVAINCPPPHPSLASATQPSDC
jgi:hypothetical protein